MGIYIVDGEGRFVSTVSDGGIEFRTPARIYVLAVLGVVGILAFAVAMVAALPV